MEENQIIKRMTYLLAYHRRAYIDESVMDIFRGVIIANVAYKWTDLQAENEYNQLVIELATKGANHDNGGK